MFPILLCMMLHYQVHLALQVHQYGNIRHNSSAPGLVVGTQSGYFTYHYTRGIILQIASLDYAPERRRLQPNHVYLLICYRIML